MIFQLIEKLSWIIVMMMRSYREWIGVRGFPRDVAVDVAAQACIEWMNTVSNVSVEDRDCFSEFVVSLVLVTRPCDYTTYLTPGK
jgi:hypothetical protein